jgi:hypothetical protein
MTTCAIVGNSSCLLDKNYGSFIDTHDEVIRFNMAKTAGFEKDVGFKTTLRFCNQHPFMCRLSESHYREHVEFFPDWNNEEILTWENQKLYLKHSTILKGTDLESQLISKNNSLYYISDLEIIKLKNIVNSEPTMGLVGLSYALSNFKTINCFGFDFYDSPNKSFHYFEKTIPYTSCHNQNDEKRLFEDLEKSEKIRIYR